MPVGVGIRQRLEQHRVDHREDGGVDPDAQGEGRDRGQREHRAPGQRADGVAQVADECIEHRHGTIVRARWFEKLDTLRSRVG